MEREVARSRLIDFVTDVFYLFCIILFPIWLIPYGCFEISKLIFFAVFGKKKS